MLDFSSALPTFFVTLREGFEAALVVGIVLACLHKAQQKQLYRWVYAGVAVGIFISILVGLLLGEILQDLETSESIYAPITQQFLEAGFGLFAIAMLSWMLIWMTSQAKSLKGEVEEAIQSALVQQGGAGWGIFSLIVIAVLREGFETVLFIVAKFQSGWTAPSLGAICGLTLAACLGFLLFKLGVKINIRLFFQVMGIFLLLIVAGLVLSFLHHLDAGVALITQLNSSYNSWCIYPGDSCLLGAQVWQGAEILPEREFPGIILKALFGYRQNLFLVQVVTYVLFLTIVGGIYLRTLSGKLLLPKSNQQLTTNK